MSDPVQVLITRAEPGATATAARVGAIGFTPLLAPLLEVRPLEATLGFEGIGALAFTSMNGLDAFAARSDRRDLPVFAIGEATAKAARRAGFTEVLSADGEMTALIRLIAATGVEGAVLHPAARQKAGDLVGGLKRAGIAARAVDLYETVAAPALPPAVTEALRQREVQGVLVHSPRGAEALAGLVADFDLSEVAALGLSAHCLRPLRALGFERLVEAATPDEAALLAALSRTLGNPSRPR